MRKLTYLSILIVTTVLFIPTLHSNITGSPGGKTNSPSDGANCTQCHTGTVNSGPGTLTVMTNIPIQGYTAGQQYTITIQLSESNINRFGFEITCEENNFGSQKTGSFVLTDAANTQFVNNSNNITHTMYSINGTNMKIWTMDWIAPSNISSGVVFYVSAIAANGNSNNSGDQVYTITRGFSEGTSSIIDKQNVITAFLNPASKDIMINSTNKIYIHSLNLYDLSGKEVYTKNDVSLPTIINVDFLNSGTYLVNMQEETGTTITEKIIIP